MIFGRYTFLINPIGKPRMTRRDKWAKRPCVMRYRAWKDEMWALEKLSGLNLRKATPVEVEVIALFPMPQSWSTKKRYEMKGAPHRQKPDADNVLKAVLDALWPNDDQKIAGTSCRKRWAEAGSIEMTIAWEE